MFSVGCVFRVFHIIIYEQSLPLFFLSTFLTLHFLALLPWLFLTLTSCPRLTLLAFPSMPNGSEGRCPTGMVMVESQNYRRVGGSVSAVVGRASCVGDGGLLRNCQWAPSQRRQKETNLSFPSALYGGG